MTSTWAASPDRAAHRWAHWTLGVVAASAAVVYVIAAADPNLHNYYTPAVVSMSESWHNFLYGAYDTSGWAGVDKIPGSLWPQAVSVALFGAHAWSVLLPEVVATVATVVMLYLAAARWRGRVAGLVAALVYATMPLAAALAKSNVPEVWFALALAIAAYLMVRAAQSGSFWWLLGTGLAVSAAFQVKMLEAWMVYPAIALAYLIAAPRSLGTRVWHTVVAGLISIAASLWWIALVTLTPAASRPWVGGTTDNSPWSMVFGYNGFGRVTGSQGSFVASFAGDAGLSRLVGPQVSVDVAWLLPLATIAVVLGVTLSIARVRDQRREPAARAASLSQLGGYVFFGVWLVVVAGVMAFSAGIHTFYLLAFAPAIAALVGGLVQEGWDVLGSWTARITASLLVVGQAAWTGWLVARADTHSWLIVAVPAIALVAIVLLLLGWRAGLVLATLGIVLAPATWAIGSISVGNAINPSASSEQAMGGPAMRGPDGAAGGPPAAMQGAPAMPGAADGGPPGGAPTGGPMDGSSTAAGFDDASAQALRDWLMAHSPGTEYLVAADSTTAGQLALVEAPGVLTLGGGFNGSDPTPTAEQLSTLVTSGELRYIVVGRTGGGGPNGGAADTTAVAAARTAWISENCSVVNDGPTTTGTLYDCAPAD
ncbi:MAG: hypothetical protein GC156_09340 [Actinomycetales bacterium]|nr:hypothetical protein [Actinomycetales bacterium]